MVRMQESEKAYRILVEIYLGNHSLVRLRKRQERTVRKMLWKTVG
jgi:hypothetical protein